MDSVRPDDLGDDLAANLAWVRRLALAIVRDDTQADDLAQEVVWRAWLRSSHERPSSLTNLRAWLATTSRRLAIDNARGETARRARELAASRPEAQLGSTDAVERGERSRCVVDAVMHLAEPYRSTILLRYLDQLPIADVAARLGASETTVRKRLSTGLAMLRTRLDGEFGEDSRIWAVALLGLESHKVAAVSVPAVGLATIAQGVLLMNAKWVAAGIGVVMLGLATWYATTEFGDVQRDGVSASSASVELTELANPATRDAHRSVDVSVDAAELQSDANAIAEPFVAVRSAVGLPLPFVDVQDAQGDWKRAELDHDRCALDPAIALPRLLRAPGHVPQAVTSFGEELELEPDALLTLEAKGLRTGTRTIRVSNPYRTQGSPMTPEMRQAVAFGFLSDDTWCVAVSHDLVRAAIHQEDFEVEILWPDHQRADVHLRALPGARGAWTVPVDRGAVGSPLRLHVQRPTDQPAGDVVFRLKIADGIYHDAVAVEQFAWGSVAIYDPRSLWMDEQRLNAERSDYTFDFLPHGVPLMLGARDEATSAYSRMTFVHDGSDRTVELQPAFVLRGCLLAADDKSPVTTVNFTWAFRDEEETEYYWRCEKFPLVTHPKGYFEARGPMHVTLRDEMTLEPPSRLFVQVKTPGFETLEREFDTAGARSFDCGEILLDRRPAQITLAPGHGVSPEFLRWMDLRISAMPDVFWEMRGGVMNSDGSMSISLEDTENSSKDLPLFASKSDAGDDPRAWPVEPGRWLTIGLLLGDHDESWLFERQDGGSYVVTPRREVELDIRCGAAPPEGKYWRLGWQLHEQQGGLGVDTPSIVGETTHVRFSIPVGAQIWWSTGSHPPGVQGAPANIGGSAPIESLQGRLVLR